MFPKSNFNWLVSNRKFARKFNAIVSLVILIFLILTGCARTGNQNNLPTDESLEVTNTYPIMEETLTSITPTVELAPTETIASPTVEVIRDFSEIEDVIVSFYSTSTGHNEIELPCWDDDSDCLGKEHPVDFHSIVDFNSLECFSYSPDRSAAVVCSGDYSKDGSFELFVRDFEDGKAYRLTYSPGYYELSASWSPSGDTIAYISSHGWKADGEIYLIKPSGCCKRQINSPFEKNMAPYWSPDGGLLSFLGNNGSFDPYKLLVYEIDTQEVIVLVEDYEVLDHIGYGWSPDGSKFAFLADRDGVTDLCIVEIVTHEVVCTDSQDYIERMARWSSDGNRLIYSAYNKRTKETDVYIIGADGSEKIQITESGDYIDPIWVGHENYFLCQRQIGETYYLVLTSIDGEWEQVIAMSDGHISFGYSEQINP